MKIIPTTKNIMKSSKIKRYTTLVMAGILFSIASKFFVIYAHIFSPGVGGFSQGITYTIYEALSKTQLIDFETFNNTFYWVVYGALNIPIAIFTYVKFGRKYLMDSLLVMAVSAATTMTLIYAPGINQAALIPDYDPVAIPTSGTDWAINYTVSTLSGILGGTLYGVAIGMVFSQGTSAMGFDPIAKYLQRDKGMNLRKVLFWFSFINSMFWIFTTEGIKGTITSPTDFWQTLISPRVLGTILFLSMYSFIGHYTSKDRTIRLEINSLKSKEIAKWIKSSEFPRTFSSRKVVGGFTNKEREIIEIIMFTSEVKEFMQGVHEIDENAFIVTSKIDEIYGNFNKISNNKWERLIEEHREKMNMKKRK